MADWASGVAPKPDPKTISKHVQRMVDVCASSYNNVISFIVLVLTKQNLVILYNCLDHHNDFITNRVRDVLSVHCCVFLISGSLYLRTTIMMEEASFPRKTLRKLLQAFLFHFVSWTKTSKCLI